MEGGFYPGYYSTTEGGGGGPGPYTACRYGHGHTVCIACKCRYSGTPKGGLDPGPDQHPPLAKTSSTSRTGTARYMWGGGGGDENTSLDYYNNYSGYCITLTQ